MRLPRFLTNITGLLAGDGHADRVVPPTGFTAQLTLFAAGAMAFLAVFAAALSISTGRLADRWSDELARTATLRISAPAEQLEAQAAAALRLLETTTGVASARRITAQEQQDLLTPWLGPNLPLDALPIPALIEVTQTREGIDADGLRARLAGEVPGAVYDDHARWRAPLVRAAQRLRGLGWLSLLLITGVMGAMITLAASAALAANARVIETLRLIGARDAYIARAFVRRFTERALIGAAIGAALGTLSVALLPSADTAGGFLTGLGFSGAGWLLPALIPVIAAAVAFWATRTAALRTLRNLS
ncbi:cell division protein FtsX [Alphaproteobacteria bacterium KMM 3653]|uniref:Cell division protein FtsX n=1 Tax=Harenicola maris TaxID=2841044 RepID=A0AAP2CVV6_9RHOB|nr:cell division protein FtsX [Harenicola maris]